MIKKLLYGLFVLAFAFSYAQVQTDSKFQQVQQKEKEPSYEDLMKSTLSIFESATTSQAYQTAYEDFLKIGKKERSLWIPYYYAAFAQKKRGDLFLKENKINELDDAIYYGQKALDESKKLSPDNVENMVIQKYFYQQRKLKVPSEIYQTGGPLALQVLSSAYKLDSNNPRVLMVKAEDLVNTPKEYGGNKEKGIEMYRKALTQFDNYKVKLGKDRKPILFYPTWGKDIVEEVLQKSK